MRFKIFVLSVMILVSNFVFADPYIDQMGDLIEEISLLNVLRGLYLTEDQAREICKLAIEAENIRKDALEKIHELNSIPALTQLRDELYTALAENPPQIRKKVVQLDNEAHRITGEALDKIARMEEKIKKILSPGQQDIFWKFVPCIVPEVDFENPVRTGQAAASSRLMPALELIRNTPQDMWEKHGQAFVDHVLKITENEVGKMTDEVREDLRRRLVKHCWKIRSMKEADFMIHKSELAEQLLLINREHTQRSGFRTTGKLARFFLSPAAARIFPKWIELRFGKNADKKLNQPPADCTPCKTGSLPIGQEKPPIWKVPDKTTDKDKYFWEHQVPTSLARLAETPYFDHIQTAFPKSYSRAFFDENDKYIEKEKLINEAAKVFLKREGKLKFYTLTQGEP
ncbi:MAG: hypothetical protein Kow0029_20650 [Candidatus Rifleibacteriota bacterium]